VSIFFRLARPPSKARLPARRPFPLPRHAMNIGNMNLNVDMYEAKNKLFQLHAMVKGYPEIKTKVKAATNLDPWGPTQAQMQEICDACNHYEDRRLVMRALWKRLFGNKKEKLSNGTTTCYSIH